MNTAATKTPRIIVTVENGTAEAFHNDDVQIVIIDLDAIKLGEVDRVKEQLPDDWSDWIAQFPVAVPDINTRIAHAESEMTFFVSDHPLDEAERQHREDQNSSLQDRGDTGLDGGYGQ